MQCIASAFPKFGVALRCFALRCVAKRFCAVVTRLSHDGGAPDRKEQAMINPISEAIFDAASEAEIIAYELKNAASLGYVLTGDKYFCEQYDGTDEGGAFYALLSMLDSLVKRQETLSASLYAIKHGEVATNAAL